MDGRGEKVDEVTLLILAFGLVEFFQDALLISGGQLCDADSLFDGGVFGETTDLVVTGSTVRTHASSTASHFIVKIITRLYEIQKLWRNEKDETSMNLYLTNSHHLSIHACTLIINKIDCRYDHNASRSWLIFS